MGTDLSGNGVIILITMGGNEGLRVIRALRLVKLLIVLLILIGQICQLSHSFPGGPLERPPLDRLTQSTDL